MMKDKKTLTKILAKYAGKNVQKMQSIHRHWPKTVNVRKNRRLTSI